MLKVISFLTIVAVLLSCDRVTSKAHDNKTDKAETQIVERNGPTLDTVLHVYGQSYVKTAPVSMDTSFTIDGELYTLRLQQKLVGTDTVSYDESSIHENRVTINRYKGRDIEYTYALYNSDRTEVWKKVFRKKDFMKSLGSIVARSNMILPHFHTYLESTGQLVLTQHFWVPDSDVGVEGILFFQRDGRHQIKYHRWYGSSGSECEVRYSEDSSCLLTCTEILPKSGTRVSIEREGAIIAGNMFIGAKHVFVSYAFQKDTTALGGRIYTTQGKLLREFQFDGYSGALSYELPHIYLADFGKYYFVDEPNKCFVVVSEVAPAQLKKIPFSSVRYAPDEAKHGIVSLSTEVVEHQLGLRSDGTIVAHKMRLYGDNWKFSDEIKY